MELFEYGGDPGVHIVAAGSRSCIAIVDQVREYVPKATCVRVLDGRAMRTFESAFEEFASRLNFPGYFGRNMNALRDCLTDLAWLPADGYVFVVCNAEGILRDEPPADRDAILRVLERVANEWAGPAGDPRFPVDAPRPFHVVFVRQKAEETL
jgi:RNAse (barnase) inhibitor barstar